MIGIGDSTTIVFSASTSRVARHGDAHDVGAGVGDATDLVHRRRAGSRSPSWSSSGRRRARRPRRGRRRRGSDGRRPCPHCRHAAPETRLPRSWPRHRRLRDRAGSARARIASPLAARARAAPPRALLRAHRPGGRACASSTSAAARWACARWSPSWTSPASTSSPRPDYPGRSCRPTPTERLPFADGEFDLVYSSSVIEHVAARPAGARSPPRCDRVGRGLYVQTPGLLVPGRAPRAAAVRPLAAARRCAAPTGAWARRAPGRTSTCCAARELTRLFRARCHAERLGPLAKSWIAIRPVA